MLVKKQISKNQINNNYISDDLWCHLPNSNALSAAKEIFSLRKNFWNRLKKSWGKILRLKK